MKFITMLAYTAENVASNVHIAFWDSSAAYFIVLLSKFFSRSANKGKHPAFAFISTIITSLEMTFTGRT